MYCLSRRHLTPQPRASDAPELAGDEEEGDETRHRTNDRDSLRRRAGDPRVHGLTLAADPGFLAGNYQSRRRDGQEGQRERRPAPVARTMAMASFKTSGSRCVSVRRCPLPERPAFLGTPVGGPCCVNNYSCACARVCRLQDCRKPRPTRPTTAPPSSSTLYYPIYIPASRSLL